VFLCAVSKSQAPTGSPVPASIVTDLETPSETAEFMENHKKVEKASIFNQNTPETLVSNGSKMEYDVDVSPASTTIILDLETRSTTAGFIQKVEKSPTFAQKAPESIISGHSKCAYNISAPTGPTAIISYFETRSESARFAQKRPKTRILSIVFNQNYPKPSVSGCFNSTDTLPTPSIAPTKHPCDLSKDCNGFFISFISILNFQTFSHNFTIILFIFVHGY
jgi:hypothetical protein